MKFTPQRLNIFTFSLQVNYSLDLFIESIGTFGLRIFGQSDLWSIGKSDICYTPSETPMPCMAMLLKQFRTVYTEANRWLINVY